ncbi:hypothetical protein [Bacteroides nordii]|uniref:hypothetical protein n=1 Tax=Bacteroides nordii TaxID=291645 RepID=UPI00399AAC6A
MIICLETALSASRTGRYAKRWFLRFNKNLKLCALYGELIHYLISFELNNQLLIRIMF